MLKSSPIGFLLCCFILDTVHRVCVTFPFGVLDRMWDLLFIRFAARAFRKLLSIHVFSYFPFSFEGSIWDLIVSVPGHCLYFCFILSVPYHFLFIYFSTRVLRVISDNLCLPGWTECVKRKHRHV